MFKTIYFVKIKFSENEILENKNKPQMSKSQEI